MSTVKIGSVSRAVFCLPLPEDHLDINGITTNLHVNYTAFRKDTVPSQKDHDKFLRSSC